MSEVDVRQRRNSLHLASQHAAKAAFWLPYSLAHFADRRTRFVLDDPLIFWRKLGKPNTMGESLGHQYR
jgi:hypothetical protein